MKECSKCHRQLDENQFVKSPRYSDGLYPSCKECRKKTREKSLLDNPNCARCGQRPHIEGVAYCDECNCHMKGRPLIRSRVVDRSNKEWCCRCKERPRLPYHNYCQICKIASTMKWLSKFRTIRQPDERRRKQSARHYINTLFKRGKIKRDPCEICGRPSQHFHHLDYNDRTTNVQHLCFSCHVQAERIKRNLTK